MPTYSRAHMLPDLITSFWAQDLADAELVIQDDASIDETATLMDKVVRLDDRIVYARNKSNVGLAENILLALRLARGKYIVILGDDDILLGAHALATYVEAFMQYPDVHFAYPNQIQVDVHLNFDVAYRNFTKGAKFASGTASFESTWLKSIQIAGAGLRRSDELYDLYPKATLLFPQLELIGRLVARHGSCGIPKFLVGVRAHGDQLGFHANRGERIVGPEKHGTIETLEIAARIAAENGQGPDLSYTAKVLARALATNLPNEKLHGSTRIAVSNAVGLMRKSSVARYDPFLLASLLVTFAAPAPLLGRIRRSAKSIVRWRQVRYADWFSAELRRQREVGVPRWRDLNGV